MQQIVVKRLMIPLPQFSYVYWLIHFKLVWKILIQVTNALTFLLFLLFF